MRKKIGILVLLAGVLLFVAAVMEELPYLESRWKNAEIRESVTEQGNGAEDAKASEERKIDFSALRAINPDICGWISIPGTPIDYPILRGSSDTYYLNHDYTGAYSYAGAIFMRERADFTDEHTILYGHNMIDNQMFGWLPNLLDINVRNAHPDVFIYLPDGKVVKARIYSAYECSDMSESYRTEFADKQEYAAWIQMTWRAGVYSDSITERPSGKEKVVTLSTCTNREADARYVIHAMYQ